MGTGKILVFNPTGTKSGKEKVGAPRLSGIEGKRIGVVWNGKLGGDVFLSRVSEVLAERFGVTVVERVDDRGDTNRVIEQAVVNRFVATCDAAIIGTGD